METTTPLAPLLPAPPDAALDRYLDAFAAVVARHGLSRARVADVAAELGVSRVTVYRQAGTTADMLDALLRRDLHRLLVERLPWPPTGDPAAALLDALTALVEVTAAHPVVAKVLADEPQLLGPYLLRGLPRMLRQLTDIGLALRGSPFAPGLDDPGTAASLSDWIGRIVVTAVIAPPPGPTRAFLAFGLGPLLDAVLG